MPVVLVVRVRRERVRQHPQERLRRDQFRLAALAADVLRVADSLGADRFHVVSPDYPGFGNTDMPDPSEFAYTFDHLSEIVEGLLAQGIRARRLSSDAVSG